MDNTSRIPPLSQKLRTRFAISLLAEISIPILMAVGAVLLFGSGGGDDSHITWWVVDELCRTGHILNINGLALEQSSSLALVVIAAVLRLFTRIPTPALGVALSILAAVGTCWMTGRLARRIHLDLAVPASVLVATSGPFVYWGTSGMETALAAFAGVWLLDSVAATFEGEADEVRLISWRSATRLLAASSLFASVRPENPLLLSIIICASFALYCAPSGGGGGTKRTFQFSLQAALFGLAPTAALFGWRKARFHEWFPHPVAAKADGGPRWGGGWKYLTDHTAQFQPAMFVLLPLAIGAGLIAFAVRRSKPLTALLAVHSAAGVAFICASGGDWMSCGRFLAPLIPIWWVTILACATLVFRGRSRWLAWTSAIVGGANLFYLVALARNGSANGYPLAAALTVVPAATSEYKLQSYSFLELANKSHLRDALLSEELKRVVKLTSDLVPGKIWIGSGQAGAVPYHVFSAFPGRLKFIDFWGLTTSEVKPCLPPSRLRHSSLGVAMPLDLIFRNRERVERDCGVPMPDIVFNTGLRAGTRKGLEANGYRVVYFQHGAMPNFSEPSILRGGTRIDAYIAVRADIAERLTLRYREVRWRITG
jgi:hypothetical protein